MKLINWHKHLYHWCPMCGKLHVIPPDGWTRSGTIDAPTYTPSFAQNPDNPLRRCHYFITNGELIYFADSWHKSTDRIAMPDIPQTVVDNLTDAVFAS